MTSAGMTSAGMTPAGAQSVRRHNLGLLARAVAARPGSRAELAQRTGLTKATVSSLVDSLLAAGLLVEGEPPGSRPGRPARPVSLNPDGPGAVGLEVNVDYLAGCLLDPTGAVRGQLRVPRDNRALDADQVVDGLAQLYAGLVPAGRSAGLVPATAVPPLGVALAVPAVVGPTGRLDRVPNLPRLAGQPLAELLGQRLNIGSVLQDNEANLGALGWLRASDDSSGSAGGRVRDFVYVSGEIGVGAGLVVGGRLFRGASGHAGELGHVVVERTGPPCGCGGRGCVEQYAGQEVLLRAAGQPDLPALVAAAKTRDDRATGALATAGTALGVGLASLLNVVDLPAVVLGGSYAELFELITPALRVELDRRVVAGTPVRVLRSELVGTAAVLGAAGAVLDRALADPAELVPA